MNSAPNVGRFLLLAVVVAACGKSAIKYPTPKQATLGSSKAEYRDYLGYHLCEMDPKVVGEDVSRVNGFFQRFVDSAQAAQSGSANEDQVATIQSAPKALKAPLAAQESLVKRVLACKEFQGKPVVDLARQGQTLVAEVKKRLALAPGLSAMARYNQELKTWKEKQETEQQSERANWCPAKPSKTPEIFFAWEDEAGTTEWLFCDNAKVVSSAGKAPELLPSPDAGKKGAAKPPPTAVYLTSAAKFPAKEIRRAPRSGAEADAKSTP